MRYHWFQGRFPLSVYRGPGHAQSGFSLLEVVVAFTILALSLGLLIQIFSRALNTTALSRDYSRAASLAQSRLDAVGIEMPLLPGSYGGGPEEGLSWQVVIQAYEPEGIAWEPAIDSYLVRSMVSWGEEGEKQRQISLATLRLAESSGIPGLDSVKDPATKAPAMDRDDR